MDIGIRSLENTELGNAPHVVVDREPAVAVVVDPARDAGQHLDVAASGPLELAWALETPGGAWRRPQASRQ